MTGRSYTIDRPDELMLALGRLRRLVALRDALPRGSARRSVLEDEVDDAQQEAWRIASGWRTDGDEGKAATSRSAAKEDSGPSGRRRAGRSRTRRFEGA